MKKLPLYFSALLILNIIVAMLITGCSDQNSSALNVVTSTSQITQIVERVGGDRVNVTNIIPPAQCPGHFDCTPDDVKKLVDADLFLLHGWQGEVFSDDLIASADNEKLNVVKVNVKVGENMNWMAPPVQSAAVDKITEALSRLDEDNAAKYVEAAVGYKEKIAAKEAEITEKLAAINPASINVLCAEQQTGFLKWAGFNVISVYGEPDTLTPQIVKNLVDTGKRNNVTLVIDNMQSGVDAGIGIAEELDCERVTLSNFPGGYDNTDTWEETIDYNVELLLNTLAE